MKKLRSLLIWFLAVGGFATGVEAASVGAGGYTNDFSTQPAAADWSFYSLSGAAGDITTAAGMDTAVQAVAAGTIAGSVSVNVTNPPGMSGSAVWCSSGLYLQTRPTANGATFLMCTLVNNLGADAQSVTISYDFIKSSPVTEEVDGHRAYYSLTGAAGSWVPIPEFSSAAAGRPTATLRIVWPRGTTLYLLWADDNGSGSPDTICQIDNFSAIATPAAQMPVSITTQPQSQAVDELDPVTFTVDWAGYPAPTFQWYTNNAPIAGATNASYTIPETPLSDNGLAFKVIAQNVASNVTCWATSSVATLTVNADTVPPVLLGVIPLGSAQILAGFSERLAAAGVANLANYALSGPGGSLTISNAVLDGSQTNIILSISPMTSGATYTLTVNGLTDRSAAANPIATNSQISFVASTYNWANVGNPVLAGSAADVSGGYDVTGGGTNIAGAADQFFFYYQAMVGDFDLEVRVDGITASDVWAKAGLMARETLAANSRFAMPVATPSLSGAFFLARSAAGGAVASSGALPVNYPNMWLRLTRNGSTFTGYAGYDGQNWVQLGTALLSTPATTFYVGLAVCGNSTVSRSTVQFREFGSGTGGAVSKVNLPIEPLGPSSRRTGLVITEIMYKPAPRTDGKELEFLELYNSNPFWENISGYKITGEINYTFPSNTVLQGGAFLVLAKVKKDVEDFYGTSGALQYGVTNGLKTNVVNGVTNIGPRIDNALNGNGGTIRLRNKEGAIYLEIPYSNKNPWPVAADGTGHSLVLARPSYGEGYPQAWAISDAVGGSPGRYDGYTPGPLRSVLINEFLANSDPPLEDYIELYNHANQPVDISGCFLSDEPATNKFMVPTNTVIPARGFIAFSESQLGFGLSSGGETIYFRSADNRRVLDCVPFDDQSSGIACGRFPDGAPMFYPLAARTPGTNNSDILVNDIVINEIMYAPISEDDDDQYVELYNKGTNAMDLGGWKFVAGIEYTFPANTILGPDGYLVVAKNAAKLMTRHPNLNPTNTVGDFKGKLSGKGERLALAMPEINYSFDDLGQPVITTLHVVLDEVTYGVGGKWGRWAHNGGSSLELIDPRSNHRLPSNWTDSDETAKAPWTLIEASGPTDNGTVAANALEGGLLDEGECLLDNVEVVQGANGTNLLANSNFELGLGSWVGRGTHFRSTLDSSGGYSGAGFHVRAAARCDYGPNRIYTPLTTTVANGTNVTIRAKVRWLCGWPEFLLRLHGGWFEATARLQVPANLGTPGARNSRAANAPPAIYDVVHSPILPAANQPAVVTARVHDPDRLAAVVLKYRNGNDTAYTYTSVPMVDDGTDGDAVAGDGIYSATIPAQAGGSMIAFLVQATDAAASPAISIFPAYTPTNGLTRECLVRFGEPNPVSSFGTYRQWLNQTAVNRWINRPYLDNEPIEGTFVYGDYRVIYNFGTRISGSPWHQGGVGNPNTSDYHYNIQMPVDDLLLGTDNFNKVHGPGNGVFDDTTLQREQTGMWIARQLGLQWTYRRFVNMYFNGNLRRANALMEDMQIPGPDFLEEFFPDDPDGSLHKNQCWFEMDDAATGGMPNSANQAWCTLNKYLTTINGITQFKMQRYRWNYFVRAVHGTANDYTNVFALIEAASTPPGPALTANLEAVADVEEWMRTWAVRHSLGDWDFFGSQNAQNSYAYKPTQGRWNVFIFDMNIILGNSGSWNAGANLFPSGSPGGSYTPGSPPGDVVMPKLFSHPPFRRMYLRALKEICNGPMVNANIDPIMDAKYAAFLANGLAPTDPSTLKTWIANARTSISGTVAAEDTASFTASGPTSLTGGSNVVTFTGSAPLNVKTIKINGEDYPVTWTSTTAWSIRLPLNVGTNQLVFQGYDVYGNPIASAARTNTVTYTGEALDPANYIVINEIMFHPLVPDAEYVELFNTASNYTFDLSGWRFNGLGYTFPDGAFINPRSYLVLVKDPSAFLMAYGASNLFFDRFDGNLQADGETITLEYPTEMLSTNDSIITTNTVYVAVDKVRYEPERPWPVGSNEVMTASSIQLIDPLQDNSRPANWVTTYSPAVWQEGYVIPGSTNDGWQQIVFTGSPGGTLVTNKLSFYLITAGDVYLDDLTLVGTNAAGQLTNFLANGDFESGALSPFVPIGNHSNTVVSGEVAHSGAYSVHLVASGPGNARTASLYYELVGLPTTNKFTLSFWYLPTANPYSMNFYITSPFRLLSNTNLQVQVVPDRYIPPQLLSPAVVSASPGASNTTGIASLAAIPPVWLNEVQPNNVGGIVDGAGEHEPWVELYNAGTNVVSLEGLYLADNYTNLAQWAFPAGATLNPGEFKVIFVDGQPEQSTATEWHTSFRLNGTNGSVALGRISSRPEVLDYLTYTGMRANLSYGDYPDGQPFQRQVLYAVTPGTNNSARVDQVFINEWMASNTGLIVDPADGSADDWFELYNGGDTAVDLSGYYLTDNLADKTQYRIPSGYVVPPHGFLLVWADGHPGHNSPGRPDLYVSFQLSKGGEAIGLFTPSGIQVDAVTFGPQTNNVSEGRYADGAAYRCFMNTPTPGRPNIWEFGANTAPQIAAIADQYVILGQNLSLMISAADPDPGQSLVFSLPAGAPAGATLNPLSGLFQWTPEPGQCPSVNPVSVAVTDNGAPPLSAGRTFTVYVVAPPQVGIRLGPGGQILLSVPAIAGKRYQVQYKDDLNLPVWTNLGEVHTAIGPTLDIQDTMESRPQRFYQVLVVE